MVENSTQHNPGRSKLEVLLLGLLLFIFGFVVLVGMSQTPPVENREIRIDSVISNMIRSGDYLLPRIGSQPHLTKPPLYYWMGSLAAKTLVGLPERVTCRLPSVFCALLTIIGVFFLCRSIGRRELALPAAIMMACFYEFYSNARCANFDMMLGFFCLLSIICFQYYLQEKRLFWLMFTGLGISLALLTKATPAIPLIFIPMICMAKIRGELKLLLKPSILLACVALPLLLCVSWFLLMLKLSPEASQIFRNEGLLPFGVKGDKSTAAHFESPAFYIYKIFKIAAPAIILLPLLVVRLMRTRFHRENTSGLRWVLLAFLWTLVLFSIIPQKQEAYLVPLLPFLALLLADAVVGINQDRASLRAVQFAGYVLAIAMLALAPVAIFYFHVVLRNTIPGILFALAFAAIGVALVFLAATKRAIPLLVAGAFGWWLFMGLYCGSMDVLDDQFKSGDVYKQPGFSQAHWDDLFASYPSLQKVFRTSKRFKDDDPNN